MTHHPEFRLVPLADLLPHEEIHGPAVRALAAHLRRVGVVDDPIWVAADSNVILNGHHRVAALRALGAERAPAWVIPYDSELIRLERWDEGPPIDRAEVVRRAAARQLFSPKTTRHILSVELPRRSTPLADLFPPGAAPRPASHHRRTSGRSRTSGARAPGSG
jgi:L-serine kinase (ADP)